MRKYRVGIIDILGKSVSKRAFARYSRANNMSIMPQVVAVWCEDLGHEVHLAYYSGPACVIGGLPDDVDVVFICAFSHSAYVAYALSACFRAKGAVTVLGGPHARSYPLDARKHFDYVVGFTDEALIGELLRECAPHRPEGVYLSARQQPNRLASLRRRWKYMEPVLAASPVLRSVPILGSLGCPYQCSFCVDAKIAYAPMDYEGLKEDLRFLVEHKPSRSIVAWHDPNFGIRFDDYMGLIEEAVPPGRLTFAAETSLSLLKEDNLKRLKYNNFQAILPGIESWYDNGDKSKTRSTKGQEKVERVAEHARLVMQYVPYMQANLIFGLDVDEGPEPFELTKHFVDLAPGVYPFFSLLMSYGRSAPDNLRYQRAGRVLNVPFHFLNQLHSMNVRPLHYDWLTFFGHVVDTYEYAFSKRALFRRACAPHKNLTTRVEQFFRGWTSEGDHKLNNMRKMHRRLADPKVRAYFDGETDVLPDFFVEPIREDLGPLWDWLPDGALYHDPNLYLKETQGLVPNPIEPAMVAV